MQFTCMNTELEEVDEIFLRNIFQWKMSRNHRATMVRQNYWFQTGYKLGHVNDYIQPEHFTQVYRNAQTELVI